MLADCLNVHRNGVLVFWCSGVPEAVIWEILGWEACITMKERYLCSIRGVLGATFWSCWARRFLSRAFGGFCNYVGQRACMPGVRYFYMVQPTISLDLHSLSVCFGCA